MIIILFLKNIMLEVFVILFCYFEYNKNYRTTRMPNQHVNYERYVIKNQENER